jgi:hypothetical protein
MASIERASSPYAIQPLIASARIATAPQNAGANNQCRRTGGGVTTAGVIAGGTSVESGGGTGGSRSIGIRRRTFVRPATFSEEEFY